MPDNDLILALSKAVDDLREGTGEPTWVPLEALLPADWLPGWMAMFAAVARTMDGQGNITTQSVWSYKHGITRRYLHIGEDLRVYRYRADLCEIGDALYERMDTEHMIRLAYAGIEDLGATRSTAYDADFIAERNRRLIAAGFTVVS